MTRFRTERLLGRMFFGRFFESELMPPDLPQLQVVIWGIALFAAPGYLMSFVFAIKYGGVPAVRLVQTTQADQMFFVTFGMMAIGIVALFMWESLFPDRRDVRILCTLPLRIRTHVLGRIGAAGAVAALFCIAINLPPAVLYGLTLWGNNVAAGPVRAVAAHFIATAMGGVFMFFTLMAAQGLLLNVFGRRMAQAVRAHAAGSLRRNPSPIPGVCSRSRFCSASCFCGRRLSGGESTAARVVPRSL